METYEISKTQTQTTKIVFNKNYFLTNCYGATIDFDEIDNGSDIVTFEFHFKNGIPSLFGDAIFDESEIAQLFNDDIFKSLIAIQPLFSNNENPY